MDTRGRAGDLFDTGHDKHVERDWTLALLLPHLESEHDTKPVDGLSEKGYISLHQFMHEQESWTKEGR